MAKCLFTDAELDANTKNEHTIQRAIGGRVQSKEVTSSEFNNLCGGKVDPYFSGVYAETMRALGPCLNSETRSASERFKIPGLDGWWKIDDRDRLVLAHNFVTYDPGGKPLSAIGPSMASLDPLIDKLRELRPSGNASFCHWKTRLFSRSVPCCTGGSKSPR